MSDYRVTNWCLCDTCGTEHEVVNFDQVVCFRSGETRISRCKVISEHQTPHEVCPHWKPKEEE